jgi:sulfur carrier protein
MSDTAPQVIVNGSTHALPSPTTLAELVGRLGHAPAAIATAVNGDFVPRDARAGRVLADGDRVQCFQPIVGG